MWVSARSLTQGVAITDMQAVKSQVATNEAAAASFFARVQAVVAQHVEAQKKEVNMESPDAKEQIASLDAMLEPFIKALPDIIALPATQRLVLVKWNNQSYDQVTWELEEDVKHEQSKILTFYRNNRYPDTRNLVSPFR